MSRATSDGHTEVRIGSNRGFGLTIATVIMLVALWPVLDAHPPTYWVLAIAAGLAAVSIGAPRVLTPFNRVWFRFGLLLHRVVSPVVMAALFFLVVTPNGLALRVFGKDLLGLKRKPAWTTYWISRTHAATDMENQF